jgi:hypothetical protein
MVPILHVIWYPHSCHQVLSSSGTNTALIRYSKSSGTRRFHSQPVPAQSSGTHTPCHLVPTLHVIKYSARPVPILCSSNTQSNPVLEGSTINQYLHSHSIPILHVIWYPYSISSGTHTLCHQVLNSSGTNTALIRYSKSSDTRRFYKSSGTRRFYSQLVPAQSSGTHTACHMVPILHVIQYSIRLVPILRSPGTPSHPIPEGSTSHLVLTLHVI